MSAVLWMVVVVVVSFTTVSYELVRTGHPWLGAWLLLLALGSLKVSHHA